jgi:hypothetical protein
MTDDTEPPQMPKLKDYKIGKWYEVYTVDQMQDFYLSRLPEIREAAKSCGYVIGLHGSLRRDLDLMAVPWCEDYSSKDDLARAIQHAACGIVSSNYDWEEKPAGRYATSFPICWASHKDFEGMVSRGHIDLSVIAPSVPANTPNPEAWNTPENYTVKRAIALGLNIHLGKHNNAFLEDDKGQLSECAFWTERELGFYLNGYETGAFVAKNTPPAPGDAETGEAIALANKVLDQNGRDPDDDISLLARQLLRSIERSAPAHGWRDISTAPKDGSRIMLAKIVGHPDHPTALWWAVSGRWSDKWKNWNDGVEPSGLAGPTHWMPLPKIAAPLDAETQCAISQAFDSLADYECRPDGTPGNPSALSIADLKTIRDALWRYSAHPIRRSE